jgi:hypothetical protein
MRLTRAGATLREKLQGFDRWETTKIILSHEFHGLDELIENNSIIEQWGLPIKDLLILTSLNWYYDKTIFENGHITDFPPTYNALLTWLSGPMQSDDGINSTNALEYYNTQAWFLAEDVVEALQNPSNYTNLSSTNQNIYNYNGPVHWGNYSYYIDEYGIPPNIIYCVYGCIDPQKYNALYVVPYSGEPK